MLRLNRMTEIIGVGETTWLDDRSQTQPCSNMGQPHMCLQSHGPARRTPGPMSC